MFNFYKGLKTSFQKGAVEQITQFHPSDVKNLTFPTVGFLFNPMLLKANTHLLVPKFNA